MSVPSDWIPIINAVFDRFERYLRWVYPGLLFMVLLRMAKPEDFRAINNVFCNSYWDLIVAGIVAGIVIYLFQGYFVNQVTSLFAVLCGWDVRDTPRREQRPSPCCCVLKGLSSIIDKQADRLELQPGTTSSYLNYSWAIYHALSMTGWLALVFYFIEDGSSSFKKDIDCWHIGLFSGVLLISAGWLYGQLTRVRRKDEQGQEEYKSNEGKPDVDSGSTTPE